ncbi:MAG: hypothetical protein AAFV53_19565 [Myxococcota bacterium]
MSTMRKTASAWGEATLSFLDNLPALSLAVGLPAILLGVGAHNLVVEAHALGGFFVLRLLADLLMNTVGIAAALWMSRRESFFDPGLGQIIAALYTYGERIFWFTVFLVVLVRPIYGLTFPILCLLLPLVRMPRWLEREGRLWSAPRWHLLIGAAPILLLSFPVQIGFIIWDIWSLEDSTPLMLGLDYFVRGLLLTFAWTVLFRLDRVFGDA